MAQLVGGLDRLADRRAAAAATRCARRAREQGTLIASGLMAGAAIVGIISAVLRLPEVGAPIRKLAIGERFSYATAARVSLKSEEMALVQRPARPARRAARLRRAGAALLPAGAQGRQEELAESKGEQS